MSDIAAVIARLRQDMTARRVMEGPILDDVDALIAAYGAAEEELAAERGAVSFWQTAELEARIRAERAEQERDTLRQALAKSGSGALAEANRQIEALQARAERAEQRRDEFKRLHDVAFQDASTMEARLSEALRHIEALLDRVGEEPEAHVVRDATAFLASTEPQSG